MPPIPPSPPPVLTKKDKLAGCFRGCAVALIAVSGVGIYIWWSGRKEFAADKERAAMLSEFKPFIGTKGPPADAIDDAQARYRKGHLLLLSAEDGKPDKWIYANNLPASLKATNAADVGTVVWYTLNRQNVGSYTNGGTAWKDDYDVVVYDVARKAIVAREHIEGEQPPQQTELQKGFGWEKAPADRLVKFLQDLPAR